MHRTYHMMSPRFRRRIWYIDYDRLNYKQSSLRLFFEQFFVNYSYNMINKNKSISNPMLVVVVSISLLFLVYFMCTSGYSECILRSKGILNFYFVHMRRWSLLIFWAVGMSAVSIKRQCMFLVHPSWRITNLYNLTKKEVAVIITACLRYFCLIIKLSLNKSYLVYKILCILYVTHINDVHN